MPGSRRLLVFGESFAAGSRVAFEDSWPARLEGAVDRLEVVNFAVDGYGMAQSFLRYRTLRDQLQYDAVLLAFVPTADLWRDVNTSRYLGEGWDAYVLMPRFRLDNESLVLVPGPYDPPTSIYAHNAGSIDPMLRRHLERYDAFYSSTVHEEPSGLRRLLVWRYLASVLYRHRIKRLRVYMLDVDSEAMRIERAICQAMDPEVRARGGRFAVVVIPTASDVKRMGKDPRFGVRWHAMVAALEAAGVSAIDLADELRQRPASDLDRGTDGSHYEPHANAIIARRVAREVPHLVVGGS